MKAWHREYRRRKKEAIALESRDVDSNGYMG